MSTQKQNEAEHRQREPGDDRAAGGLEAVDLRDDVAEDVREGEQEEAAVGDERAEGHALGGADVGQDHDDGHEGQHGREVGAEPAEAKAARTRPGAGETDEGEAGLTAMVEFQSRKWFAQLPALVVSSRSPRISAGDRSVDARVVTRCILAPLTPRLAPTKARGTRRAAPPGHRGSAARPAADHARRGRASFTGPTTQPLRPGGTMGA